MGELFSGKPTGRKVGTGRENGGVIKKQASMAILQFHKTVFYEESNYIHVHKISVLIVYTSRDSSDEPLQLQSLSRDLADRRQKV